MATNGTPQPAATPAAQPPATQQPTAAAEPSVPMISGDFTQTKMVPVSQIGAAKEAGWDNALKMSGPKGESKWAPASKVNEMRSAHYAVTPDNAGVQKMVTPQGQVTYALPEEVDKFEKSGHTLINPDGTFKVMPLPGEDNLETMDRAKNVIKAMTPAERETAMHNEIHPFDPRPVSSGGSGMKGVGRLAVHGVVAPIVVGGGTMAALGAAGPATEIIGEGAGYGRAAYEGAKLGVKAVLPPLARQASMLGAKAVIQSYAKQAVVQAVNNPVKTALAAYGAYKLIEKFFTGDDNTTSSGGK